MRLLLSGLHVLLLLPGHLLLLLLVLLLQLLRLLLVLLLQLLLLRLISLLLRQLLVFLLLLLLELLTFLRLAARAVAPAVAGISGSFRRSPCWEQVCEEWAGARWDEPPCWGEERCSRAGQPDCSAELQPGGWAWTAVQPERCSQAAVGHCSEAGRLAFEYWPWADLRHDSEEECMALQPVWRVLRHCLETPRASELPQ